MSTSTDQSGADQHAHEPENRTSTSSTAQAEPTKPITVMLPDDVLKKLKIVAIVKETSVSELVADAAAGVLRKELKKALAKISGE